MVVPALTPVTTPAELTVATNGFALNHKPPLFPFDVYTTDEPAQTVDGPLIVPALAVEFTLIVNAAEEAPQTLVTV